MKKHNLHFGNQLNNYLDNMDKLEKYLEEHEWTLMKTNHTKPAGFKGYNFTLYEKDGITVKYDIYGKSQKKIWEKIKYLI